MNENVKAGLTATGFKRKTFEDVTSDIEQDLKSSFGTISCEPSSVFGQITAAFAEKVALIWEELAGLYSSQYPDTAEGVSLDAACVSTGIKRLDATYTKVICQLTAVNYTTIPRLSEVLIESSNSLFALVETITITNEKCQSIALLIKDDNLDIYSINLNNQKIVFDNVGKNGIQIVSTSLVGSINDISEDVSAKLEDDNIIITSDVVAKSFSCFVSEGVQIVSCTNNALFKAKKKGSIVAPSFAINIIQTPVQGWISACNINAGVEGRELESDLNLRARRKASVKKSGSGTLEAIRARILDIKGVSFATIIDNFENKLDAEGRPAKSFEVLVLGGRDFDIAKAIWQAKPAGIKPWGNTRVIIKDSTDKNQCIKFSRPVMKHVYVKLELEVEDNFNLANIDIIKQALVEQINSIRVGQNLVYQSLFASVYCVIGIMNADLNIGATATEENLPDFRALSIKTKTAEILMTDSSKIVIKVV